MEKLIILGLSVAISLLVLNGIRVAKYNIQHPVQVLFDDESVRITRIYTAPFGGEEIILNKRTGEMIKR